MKPDRIISIKIMPKEEVDYIAEDPTIPNVTHTVQIQIMENMKSIEKSITPIESPVGAIAWALQSIIEHLPIDQMNLEVRL